MLQRWRVKRRAWVIFACLTLVNIGLGAVLWSLLTPASHLISGTAFEPLVGHPAPDFTLTPWQGSPIHLAALQGRPVVLNFWASWCDPCRQEAPTLAAAWRKYRGQGMLLLGVDYHDTTSAAQQFLASYHITYPNGPDVDDRISADYEVNDIPTTIFIDRSGIVVRTILGQLTAATLDGEIQQLISTGAGQPEQQPRSPSVVADLDRAPGADRHSQVSLFRITVHRWIQPMLSRRRAARGASHDTEISGTQASSASTVASSTGT